MSQSCPGPLAMLVRPDTLARERDRPGPTQSDEVYPAESTTTATTQWERAYTAGSPGPLPPTQVVELVLRLLQEEISALETAAGRHYLTVGQFTRRGVAEFLARERQIVGQRHPAIKEGEPC